MEKLALALGAVVMVIVLLSLFAVVAAIPTYYLWNWLMPDLFALKTITFVQAIGLNFLTGILFKSHNSSKSEKK
jgi:hypothetical protein